MDKFRVSGHLCLRISLSSTGLHISIFFMYFFLLVCCCCFFFIMIFETDTNTFSLYTAMNQKALFTSLDYSIAKATNYLISNDNRIE